MVCLGLDPGVAGWKAQTNPLSYSGTPILRLLLPLVPSLTELNEISTFASQYFYSVGNVGYGLTGKQLR